MPQDLIELARECGGSSTPIWGPPTVTFTDSQLCAFAFRIREQERADVEALFWLIARDYVFLSTYNGKKKDHDEGYYPALNCNDTFYYASADACSVDQVEVRELKAIIEKWGWDGAVAWAAIKRDEVPLKQLLTPKFYEAHAAIRSSIARLGGEESK